MLKETWIIILAFQTALRLLRTSTLPSIQVVRYCNEWRGESETGLHRPPMVRSRDTRSIERANRLTPTHSIQEALRTYFLPIKNDDPQLAFYTMYKRETVEYDTEYMQKYSEDLNTALIFVSFCVLLSPYHVNHIFRPVCSPPSAPPSSSTSSPSSSQTSPMSTFGPFSSTSTDPLLQAESLQVLQRGMAPLQRLSRPRISCTQAFWCRCWPRLSQCWASSG